MLLIAVKQIPLPDLRQFPLEYAERMSLDHAAPAGTTLTYARRASNCINLYRLRLYKYAAVLGYTAKAASVSHTNS